MKKYQYTVWLLLFSFFSCHAQIEQIDFPKQLNNQKTGHHKRIKGTRIFINYPEDYEYQVNLTRIQKKRQQYLQFLETESVNFTDIKRESYTKSALEAKGLNYEEIQHIRIQGYEGMFSIGPSKDLTEEKILLIFGNESFYVLIVGVINKRDKEGKKELVDLLKTIHFEEEFLLDPLELANFELDLGITDFVYNGYFSSLYTFSKDTTNLSDAADITINNFVVMALPKMEMNDLEGFAKDILFRLEVNEVFLFLAHKDLKKQLINGYDCFVLDTNLDFEGAAGILYLVAVKGKNSTILFMGTAFDNPHEMKELYKETVVQMRFKED